jgi:CHAD domain-containing protein
MEIQNLILFLEENSRSLNQNFKIAKKLGSPDSVHDLRIAIKRLNALVQLINSNKSSNYILTRNFAQLKRLFKAAGSLRDFQVLEELLLNYSKTFSSISKIISAQFQNNKYNAQKEFLVFINNYDHFDLNRVLKCIIKHIQKLENDLLEIHIQNICQNNMLKLMKYSIPDSKEYNLHSARKVVKNFAYWQEMEYNESTQNNYSYEKLKEAGRYLGNWHDRMVLYNFLISSKKKGQIKTKNLKPILIQVKNEMNEFKDQYFTLYKNIISGPVIIKPQTQTNNSA